MVIFSLMLFSEKINLTNLFLMIGSMLFIFSDISVIWVSFTERYNLDSLIIMVTYIIAQIGIINWYIVNEKDIVLEKVKKIS